MTKRMTPAEKARTTAILRLMNERFETKELAKTDRSLLVKVAEKTARMVMAGKSSDEHIAWLVPRMTGLKRRSK